MKTPKEKAAELVESNLEILWSNTAEYELEFFKSRAKKCAIIAVNEILKDTQNIYYWHEVKLELKKL